MITIHDMTATEALFRSRGLDPERLRWVRNRFYKRGESPEEFLDRLEPLSRKTVGAEVRFGALELVERRRSERDEAVKLLFRTADDQFVESVILPIESGRTTLCVSTQIGCAARCAFCATGRDGLARSLGAEEILDQLIQANRELRSAGATVRNVVFMGMGEPLHNERALYPALEVLLSERCFGLAGRRVTVSTVGVPKAMVRIAERYPEVRLALSLHSARSATRRELIPTSKDQDLDALRIALSEVTSRTGRPVMIEYLLLRDLTDTPEELKALIDWLDGLTVRVNLIPFNTAGEGTNLRPASAERTEAFAAELRQRGFEVTRRYSLGSDIAAACGQLARRGTEETSDVPPTE